MDPQTDLPDLVEDLEVNIDELTSTLAPLLAQPLHKQASTLPLLDKAKLQIHAVYAIESLIYSALLTSGVDAKAHPVFKELARLKDYFAKVKQVEGFGDKPSTRLDKKAAARFIRHGLAGNDKYDLQRAERMAKEKARAVLKARQMNIKFDPKEEDAKQADLARKRKAAEEVQQEAASSEEDHVDSENEDFYGEADAEMKDAPLQQPASKKTRVATSSSAEDSTSKPSKKTKKHKANKHSSDAVAPPADAQDSPKPSKSARKKKQKRQPETILPERSTQPPKAHSEFFSALLDGSFSAQKKEAKAKKAKK